MGRYLDDLKKSESGGGGYLINLKNPLSDFSKQGGRVPKEPKKPTFASSLGLLGTPPGPFQKIHEQKDVGPTKPEEGGFLGFLGAPPGTLKINQAANDPPHEAEQSTHFGWLIHYADRGPMFVSLSPMATHEEVLKAHPDAMAAEPSAGRLTPVSSERYAVTAPTDTDDRITCRQCQHLTYGGICSVACPGGAVSANRGYRPSADRLQRCTAYESKPTKGIQND